MGTQPGYAEQPGSERRIGLLGGTFDPIHYGHLAIAEEVRAAHELSEVVFIPAGHPPHKPGRVISSAADRLAMLRLALASNPAFRISSVDLERPGPSYTVDTLRLLHKQWGPSIHLDFIIGGDSLEDLTSWYDPAGILARLTHLVAVGRPGYIDPPGFLDHLERRLPGMGERLLFVPVPQLEISSSDLRQRVAAGRPIKYQTPEAVETYILQRQLYQGMAPRRTEGDPETHDAAP